MHRERHIRKILHVAAQEGGLQSKSNLGQKEGKKVYAKGQPACIKGRHNSQQHKVSRCQRGKERLCSCGIKALIMDGV
eukprot:1137883-Pelagomonas_calceolata.AAC.4